MQTEAPSSSLQSRHSPTDRRDDVSAATKTSSASLTRHGPWPMTVPAMRAAVIAIRGGVFDRLDGHDGDRADEASSARTISERCRPDVDLPLWATADVPAPVVVVLPGHAGAGASAVALAVAEGLAQGQRVQLVDYAEPLRSGLAAASTIELGTDNAGWRRGRRGRLDVFRLGQHPSAGALPPLPEVADTARLAVVDAGWAVATELLASPGPLARGSMLLVVTRVTVPAMGQTEHVLAAVGGEAVVAAVGPAQWPRAVQASCGPRLAELRLRGRVVRVPWDRRLATSGLTSDRLPKGVAAAGRSLAALLMPAAPPPSQPQSRHRAPGAQTRHKAAGVSR